MKTAGNYFLNSFAPSVSIVALAGVTLAAPAWAEDYTAVVTGDNVYIRCGAGPTYYPFGKLNKGAVVEVSGEEFGWAHIQTTGTAFDDMFGYVKAEEVRLSADGESAITLGVVQVLAPNSLRDYQPESSWKWVCRLQPEVAVQIIGREEGQSEMFYRVALPDVGRGFVSVNFLRKATAEEIAEEKQRLAQRDGADQESSQTRGDSDASTKNRPLTGAVEEANEVEATLLDDVLDNTPDFERQIEITDARDRTRERAGDVIDDQQEQPAEVILRNDPVSESHVEVPVGTVESSRFQDDANRVDTSDSIGVDFDSILSDPIEPTTVDVSQPIEQDIYTNDVGRLEESAPPVDTTPDSMTNEEPLIDIDDMQPMVTEPVRTDLPIDMNFTLDDVEEAYSRLKTEPIRDAEIEPLRQRYLALQETELNERDRVLVDARVTLLDARVRLQEKMFELDRLRARADQVDEQAETVRIAVESAQDYVAVGEVTASTIYNGQRLPQMLRLADPATGRTVAYLDPRQSDIEVGSLLGQLVGVLGEKHYDEGMRLTIVRPIRIDLLTPSVAANRQ